MQNLKIEFVNEIDLTFLDNEFFVDILDEIIKSNRQKDGQITNKIYTSGILVCACLDTSKQNSFALRC